MPFPNAGQVNTSTPTGVSEFLLAKMATQQSANIAANDHLKYDTVIASRGGSIALDTSTAYVNTQGTASIGRFTLKAGRTYRLTGSVPYFLASGATGLLEFTWWDATNNAELPCSRGMMEVATSTSHEIGGGDAEAVFSPTQDTLVELRLTVATAATQIGVTTNRPPVAYIETL